MVTIEARQAPIKLYGLPALEETGAYHRLPPEIGEAVPTVNWLRKVPAGARARFRTDAGSFTVSVEYEPFRPEDIVYLRAQTAVTIYVNQKWSGDVLPESVLAGNKPAELEVRNHGGGMADVTAYLPTARPITRLTFTFPDGAKVEAPTPYPNEGKPILFYGSSITQGLHASRPANTYVNQIGRRMGLDIVNLGFSGNARGEPEIARYLAALPMSVFVLDFDHNCPDIAMLSERHEPFYRRVREENPDLPILMISRPDGDSYPVLSNGMRKVIRATYDNAVADGDRQVWFIDGRELFGEDDRDMCTVDGCHPNDLGSYRMANRIRRELTEILKANGNALLRKDIET